MATSNVHTLGTFFPDRANMWFAGAKFSSDVGHDGVGKINLGPALVAADPNGILSAQSIASAQDIAASGFASTYSDSVMGRFGRNVNVDGSAASTAVITVYGFDYLGQPMYEEITMNGTTSVEGKKAFARVTRIVTGTDADSALDVGWGNVLGLPYKLIDLITELVDGLEPADAGAVVKGINTAQTATSADSRGTYTPHANNVPDGSKLHELVGIWDNFSAVGLYGLAQYNG
ncbi:MAG: hypothetical protein KKH61_21370 [Gammaproteobacteria bacterium]|uniref:Uncharacterized protein n=1 Tax=viral metagenome TaxID=1070528 RepID=A0A6H1ZB24_9ZZZZ|nr:hypothetical protein [Gammaproteobacteria bacterium]